MNGPFCQWIVKQYWLRLEAKASVVWSGLKWRKSPPGFLNSFSFFLSFFVFSFLFWLPQGIRSSPARGQGTHPSRSCTLKLQPHQNLNPQGWAGDRTCVLSLQRRLQSRYTTVRIPSQFFTTLFHYSGLICIVRSLIFLFSFQSSSVCKGSNRRWLQVLSPTC